MSDQNTPEKPEAEQHDEWKDRFDNQGEPAAAKSGETPPIMPQVNFATFVLSIASSALVQLGEVPNPETGKEEQNLILAKHSIDVLTMLRDKVKSGLDQEEERLLEGVLYELRMKYVIKSQ